MQSDDEMEIRCTSVKENESTSNFEMLNESDGETARRSISGETIKLGNNLRALSLRTNYEDPEIIYEDLKKLRGTLKTPDENDAMPEETLRKKENSPEIFTEKKQLKPNASSLPQYPVANTPLAKTTQPNEEEEENRLSIHSSIIRDIGSILSTIPPKMDQISPKPRKRIKSSKRSISPSPLSKGSTGEESFDKKVEHQPFDSSEDSGEKDGSLFDPSEMFHNVSEEIDQDQEDFFKRKLSRGSSSSTSSLTIHVTGRRSRYQSDSNSSLPKYESDNEVQVFNEFDSFSEDLTNISSDIQKLANQELPNDNLNNETKKDVVTNRIAATEELNLPYRSCLGIVQPSVRIDLTIFK